MCLQFLSRVKNFIDTNIYLVIFFFNKEKQKINEYLYSLTFI